MAHTQSALADFRLVETANLFGFAVVFPRDLCYIPHSQRAAREVRRAAIFLATAQMNRVIVIIHGTGRTAHDFWSPHIQALAEQLGHTPPHRPVWWGDLIDAGAAIARSAAWLNARLHALAQRWRGRPARHTSRLVTRAADFLHRWANGVAGVLAYFVFTRRRAIIRERLRATLQELTRRGDEIVLVSESLGCLIAFDVLRAEAAQYNLVAWITLGCALRMLVRSKQRSADLGAITPQTIGQWLNVYAPRDPIAAPIASVFPTFPIHDECLTGARDRLQAHRYWSDPRVGALIARVLRQESNTPNAPNRCE